MDRSKKADITAVILDYGEVLCYSPTAENWERMAKLFNVDAGLFRQLWGRRRLIYDRGDLSYEAYWAEIAQETGTTLGPELLKTLSPWDIEMWARINPTMVEWLKRLHSSGIKTGLLSNMPFDMINYARQQFVWLKNFDHLTFSAEVRVTKPDAAIYRLSLEGLGAAASETLFLDDKELNVEGARALGIHAFQFQSVAGLKDDLEKIGFRVLPAELKSPSLAPTL